MLPVDEDVSYLEDLAEMLRKASEDHVLYIVTGGGWIARKYINWGRKLGANESTLDELGISTSRLNASLLSAAIGEDVYPEPAKNFSEAVTAGNHYDIVIMGGTHPGHTTDAVAAMLAEKLGAERMINITSVDGVYTADPRKDEEAERLPKLDYDELISIVSKGEKGAGPNIVFDPLAAHIIKRADITTYIVSGDDLDNIASCIEDEGFHGTTIS